MNNIQELQLSDKLDPSQFDMSVQALLIGLGAEKYIDIFRKLNIGQNTLVELTDEDLVKLEVDDEKIRSKLLEEIKSLPIYEESFTRSNKTSNLGCLEVIQILEETSSQLYRIYLSSLANSITIKKSKNLMDCNLYKDKYASDIALSTIEEINSILKSMDSAIYTNFKEYDSNKSISTKKIVVGVLGSVTIGILTFLFIQSIRKI